MMKNFKIAAEEIQDLIPNRGGCIASDNITVDGMVVGYMYREEPDFEADNGWRIYSGFETQEYADDANHFEIYDINTIANYDPAIIPYLDSPIGTELERIDETNKFRNVDE